MGQDARDVSSLTRARVSALDVAHVNASEVDPEPEREAMHLLAAPGGLNAESAVRVALLNNRELRARLREVGVARGALVQAGVLPNPAVEAELLPERNTTLELRVEYNLTGLVLAPLRKRAARAELEAVRYAVASDILALGFHVRAAFYAAQAAQQRLAFARQALDALAAAREAAQALRTGGGTTALDLEQNNVAFERARITVTKMELAVLKAHEALTRLFGAHGEAVQWSCAGVLTEPATTSVSVDSLETRALVASLELAARKSRLEALAKKAGVASTEGLVPDVTVDVHALAGDPTAQANLDKSWRFGGGVRVVLPLFDRKQGHVLELESQFDAELERYYGAAIDLRSRARELRAELSSSHARARQYQVVIVPSQKRITAETLLQYNAMQVGIFHLLNAKRDELDAELAYVETLREYWTTQAAVDTLCAGRVVTPGNEAPSDTVVAAPAQGVH